MKYYWILIVALCVGCTSVEQAPEKPKPREWPQTCEMCGATLTVTPVRNPDEKIPPTVEWCFNDGAYCDEGLGLMLKANHVMLDDLLATKREFLKHCMKCKGCRCASFDPDDWKKITDGIIAIREK